MSYTFEPADDFTTRTEKNPFFDAVASLEINNSKKVLKTVIDGPATMDGKGKDGNPELRRIRRQLTDAGNELGDRTVRWTYEQIGTEEAPKVLIKFKAVTKIERNAADDADDAAAAEDDVTPEVAAEPAPMPKAKAAK